MSMELSEAIKGRKSVRSFTKSKLPKRVLDRLLKAAVLAPSAGNRQSWEFIVVTKQDLKKQLVKVAGDQQFIAEAPVVIVVCANEIRSSERYGSRGKTLYCLQDTAAAIQNILLTAFSIGLGTCWVGAFSEEEAKHALHIPLGVRPIAIIPVGYPAEKASARNRRPLTAVTHHETY